MGSASVKFGPGWVLGQPQKSIEEQGYEYVSDIMSISLHTYVLCIIYHIYMFPVPGLVAPLPPPQCYGTPPSHQKSHICMLLQHLRVMASHWQHLRAIYILPTKYLGTNYVHDVYILPIYIYIFHLHLYTTNSVPINYSFIYILPIACLYAIYIPLVVHQPPRPPTPLGGGATT